MKQPNIILIMTDQLRGDSLGCMGHPDVKTPYIDTLASRGALFENAYSACPTCIPARAALHTGMSQEHHGRVGYEDGVDWRYAHTLAGELSKAGYYTKCVGKMHVHPLRNMTGFHHIQLHDGYLHYRRRTDAPYYESQRVADDYMYWLKSVKGIDADITDSGLECNSWVTRPWPYEESAHPTNWVTSGCIDFLRQRDRQKPFFLMASYLRPHPPFDAPQPYFDMYKDKALKPPVIGDWADEEALKAKGRIFDSATGPLDEDLIRQAQAGYYACITHLDHQIGRLIQALIDDNVYEDAIILFTSDHGEMLCDHHLFRKALPYEGSSHIPMILSAPESVLKTTWGSRLKPVVELRDVMPTLLDAAGAAIPDSVDGKSLLPLIKGKEGTVREYLHGEHAFGSKSNQWIVTEHDKYIWFSQSGEEQYFDLDADPYECRNLAGAMEYGPRINELRHILIEMLQGREEGYVKDGQLIPGRKPADSLSFLKK